VNSSKAVNLFANPFFTWGRLAWKAGEMAMASMQVIGHRTHRLVLAGIQPSAHDQSEFVLMGQEKAQAMTASAQAVGMRLLMLNQQFAALAFKQMMSAAGSLMSIATSRTVAESVERQSKLVRDTMTSSAVTASKLSGATAQLAQRALAPVHARVKGNVRRLGRKSS
jgi:hypothetical protein